tara:strand:+ start:20862 stop:21071 length:210 start_codon:yes stop_codon:yes gene_type:complete
MKDVVDEVIEAYGGIKAVQSRFGYSEPMAVYNWRSRGLPRYLLADIHLDTQIPIERLQLAATGGHTRAA